MAVNTNVKPDPRLEARPDVRRRSDELNRDFIATDGGAAPVVVDDKNDVSGTTRVTDANSSRELLQLLEMSGQNLRHAAESVENRGLKLLLKVMAQERVAMYNSLRQALGKEADDPLDRSKQPLSSDLRH